MKENTNENILRGLKCDRASIKLIELDDKSYCIEVKRYFFGILFSSKRINFAKYEDAEDKYLYLSECIKTGRFSALSSALQ